jgi:hypothetical protein
MMTKGLEPRPAFQRYLAHLAERPAYRRANERADKLMAQMKAEG